MPRRKKDGRFINYYLDRNIYERLERYAEEKGQQMTTAIERILKDYLDRYEAQAQKERSDRIMYCENCNVLTQGNRCPICSRKNLREPMPGDYCYVVEKEFLWAGVLGDIFEQNQIPFVTRDLMGAGLAAKVGPAMERTRFYVPFSHYANAKDLVEGFVSAKDVE